MRAPVRGILRKLPTTKKLQLIVLVFVCILLSVLTLVYAGSRVSSAARAYVGGEGLWSKAQKEAALKLEEYAATRDEKAYQQFLDSVAVTLGDRQARVEMDKPNPDEQTTIAGFRQGRIPEGDIPGLIMLYRRFRKTDLIETASAIWTQGDVYIDELRREGSELHDAIQSGKASNAEIAGIVRRIEQTDGKLTPLENDFSNALSSGARKVDRVVMVGLPLAAFALLALGMAIAITVSREIDASEEERSRAEAATRESERRYRELLENANDMIYVHDMKGNFISWNRKAEELLGYKMREMQGINIRDVVVPEDLELADKMLQRKLEGKSSPPYSLRLISKSGQRCEVEVSSRLLYAGENVVGVQGIARDLGERRRLEAELIQAQKMEAVGRLAGGIAHDFNNILMIVRGYGENLLEQRHREDPLYAQAEQIVKAANRAAELTQRLLGFSRKQVFEPKVVELNGLVSEIGKVVTRLLGEDIELSLELHPEAGNINVDPIQLEQVLMNLVVNSRDAMPQGGKLIIGTRCRELEGDERDSQTLIVPGRYVEIAVRDSGGGMDAKTMGHIFEPFFTTKEKGKGTGLGLSTVYGIVKRSGGYIFASSEVGIGTTMRVYLPQVQMEPETACTPEPKAGDVPQGSGTMLIAEDEEALRHLISEKMRAEGYEVLEAADGEEAVEIATRYGGQIQLLLTDVVMPKMRGPEVAEKLRLLYPEIKVIFMSGYTESALVQNGVLEKNTVLLQKPFTVKKVLEAVQQLKIGTRG